MKIVSLDSIPEITTSHNKAGKKKVFIENNLIPHITQYARIVFDPSEIVEEHSHSDMYEIMYVEEGAGIFKIDGIEHAVKKGDCVTIEPNEKHEVRVTGENPLVLFVTGIRV